MSSIRFIFSLTSVINGYNVYNMSYFLSNIRWVSDSNEILQKFIVTRIWCISRPCTIVKY